MERELIPTLIPPPGASQPLLAPANTVTDDSEDKDGGIGLRTLNRILADSIPHNKDTDEPDFIQPAVVLPTSGSIQADLMESADDDPEIPMDYQLLAGDDQSIGLYDFLATLGITRQQIDRAKIPKTVLLKLYQQEFSYFSWLKWSSLDHAIEKNLQWPLLSPADVGTSAPQTCDYRVRPHERAILLKTTWGLIKAYAVRGFVQGMETGLLESVHYFIYAMLAYRLGELAKTGQSDFEEFQGIFSGSNQKGIDSLVQSLAKLEVQGLKFILAAPFLLGVLLGIVKIRNVRRMSAQEFKEMADQIHSHLAQPGGFGRNVFLEKIPLLSTILSLGSQVQKLEQWIRWDGRLDRHHRRQAFELIRQVAWEGDKITQLNALESLAKIAHGIGLKDFPRLQRAGYSPEELTELFYIKATALADVETLSQRRFAGKKIVKSGRVIQLFAPLPRRLYASYLLWWLGQSTSWWTQRLPFALLKTVKLALEALFLREIAASILEAIRCPDKPGFQFADGYQDWASDYSAECFSTRVSLFRTLDSNESVDALVAEIPHYHLTELTTLYLYNKYLTSEEASQIIQAVVQQGAHLQMLDLGQNHIKVLSEGMLNGLSQLTSLYLSSNQISVLSEGVFSGLSQLTSLYLSSNQISVLSEGVFSGLSQLTSLYLSYNQISVLSEGAFSGLSQLTILGLVNNNISVLSESVFSGLSQLTSLDLSSNQISVLSEGVFSGLSQLTSLDLSYNQISVLSEGVFSGLSQLTTLNLQSNQISIFSEGTFSGLSQLTTLDLWNNQISALSKGVLSGLSQLTTLDLGGNQISVLSEGVFSGLSRLTSLYLHQNLISVLSEGVFSGLSQLTTLYLYWNQISVLSEGVFGELSQLQILYLSDNFLNTSTLISILPSLPMTLTALDISLNQISTLPQNFSTLLPLGLKSLLVGGNSFIPRVLTQEFMQYFPFRLTTLGLESSFIVNITNNSFSGFSALTILYLGNNQISILSEGAFSGLSQLTYLSLGGNQISVLSEGMFSGLSQLTTLGLGGNQISVLSEGVFSGLSQLTTLGLGYNQISVLSEGVFSGLSQLTYLELSYNQISVLREGAFSGLSQLTILGLVNNNISVLSEGAFSGLSQLTSLYLGGNQISVLSEGVLSGLSQLTSLYLADNQLNDTAIQNLTRNFPYQLNTLEVNNNQISNDGALTLAEILPCTNLTYISFTGNPANDTALAIATQQTALQKICEDQRCHANLPATESCGVNTNPSTTAQMIWELFDSASEVDETQSDSPDHFDWPHPVETLSFQPTSALPNSTSESTPSLLTPIEAGAMILGVAGLSILLYKNSTWIQAIVNTGSNLFQRCWGGGKAEETKPTSPAHSVHSRYAFLLNLPTFSAQRVSAVTRTTDMTLH